MVTNPIFNSPKTPYYSDAVLGPNAAPAYMDAEAVSRGSSAVRPPAKAAPGVYDRIGNGSNAYLEVSDAGGAGRSGGSYASLNRPGYLDVAKDPSRAGGAYDHIASERAGGTYATLNKEEYLDVAKEPQKAGSGGRYDHIAPGRSDASYASLSKPSGAYDHIASERAGGTYATLNKEDYLDVAKEPPRAGGRYDHIAPGKANASYSTLSKPSGPYDHIASESAGGGTYATLDRSPNMEYLDVSTQEEEGQPRGPSYDSLRTGSRAGPAYATLGTDSRGPSYDTLSRGPAYATLSGDGGNPAYALLPGDAMRGPSYDSIAGPTYDTLPGEVPDTKV